MAPAVTRAIRWLSTLQGQSSTQKANSIARMTVFSKEHFPKFLGLVGVSGFVSGFYLQQSLHNKKVCATMMLIKNFDDCWQFLLTQQISRVLAGSE